MAISFTKVCESRHSRNLMFLFLLGIYNMAVSFTSVTFQIGTPVCSRPAAAHNTLENKKQETLNVLP